MSVEEQLQIQLQRQVQELMRENETLKERLKSYEHKNESSRTGDMDVALPAWFESLRALPSFRYRLEVREWEDRAWRVRSKDAGGGGWSGSDYVHCPKAAGVRVLDYFCFQSAGEDGIPISDYSLVGVALFTEKAESHIGLCHGGSMCALMDDVVGWLGFCADGELKPWSGFTVQIDTALKKAVAVGSVLRLEAEITQRVGQRKIFIKARLLDPINHEIIYCECNGLFLKK